MASVAPERPLEPPGVLDDLVQGGTLGTDPPAIGRSIDHPLHPDELAGPGRDGQPAADAAVGADRLTGHRAGVPRPRDPGSPLVFVAHHHHSLARSSRSRRTANPAVLQTRPYPGEP